jgi:hypothetical protein
MLIQLGAYRNLNVIRRSITLIQLAYKRTIEVLGLPQNEKRLTQLTSGWGKGPCRLNGSSNSLDRAFIATAYSRATSRGTWQGVLRTLVPGNSHLPKGPPSRGFNDRPSPGPPGQLWILVILQSINEAFGNAEAG